MSKVIIADSDPNEYIQNADMVLMVFSAQWCGPCKTMEKPLSELSLKIDGMGVQIVKVDVDRWIDFASQYSIMSIPSIRLFKGASVIEQSSGITNNTTMMEWINKHRD